MTTDHVQLDHNTQLRSISIHIQCLEEVYALPRLLSTVSSTSVRRVTIRFYPGLSWTITPAAIGVALQPKKCAHFDQLLSSNRFPSLECVVFDVSPSIRPLLFRSLDHAMPLLAARRLIAS